MIEKTDKTRIRSGSKISGGQTMVSAVEGTAGRGAGSGVLGGRPR